MGPGIERESPSQLTAEEEAPVVPNAQASALRRIGRLSAHIEIVKQGTDSTEVFRQIDRDLQSLEDLIRNMTLAPESTVPEQRAPVSPGPTPSTVRARAAGGDPPPA